MKRLLVLSMLCAAPAAHAEILRTISYDHDEAGRVIRERHVDPVSGTDTTAARYTYDDAGRLLTTTDGVGRTTTMTYDALGRIATTRDAAGGVASFAYDIADRIAMVIDPRGLVTSYDYDGYGQLRKHSSPDTGTTRHEYTAAGLRTRTTRNDGSVVEYAHDSLGRMTQAKSDTSERNFVHDTCQNGKGRLCEAQLRENGAIVTTVTHAYTPQGWLTMRRDSGVDDAGIAYDSTIAYAQDGMGRVTGIAYPNGVGVGYGFTSGRLHTITATIDGVTRTVANSIAHQPFGTVAQWTYANGLNRRYNFDADGRLTGVSAGQGATLVQSLTYGFNDADEITALTHGVTTTESRKFEYDALGRLSRETLHGRQWTHDANGNVDSVATAGDIAHATIDPNSNRIIAITANGGTRTFGYDALGSRIAKDGPGTSTRYTYDAFNRMRTATVNGAISRYTINALDQRIGKSTPNGKTQFVYAEQNRLMAEKGSTGWTNYVWLGNELIATIQPDNVLRYVHNDHLGRPEAVSDGAKQVIWRAANAEYGRSVVLDQIGGLNIGLPGQYFDAETGLWQNGFRDYDQEAGYIQADPIGLAGGSYSTYSYAGANPIKQVDSTGLGIIAFGVCTAANAAFQLNSYRQALKVPGMDGMVERLNAITKEMKDCPVDDHDRYAALYEEHERVGQQLLDASKAHAQENVAYTLNDLLGAVAWEVGCGILLLAPVP
ncbi:RHS-repeat-containing protein [Lysobacter dokdonensis DS-58]|uniref:RHS-repeat-containing protein n=1 Tax=Lysobacter dokdonensis DS-58 TaxID=1300345 RepID=A0A0A2WEW0_9GAMM|nr:RHS repeat-associated core domain-containing protein [Lysobacter dokdonensis]KGQ18731.1 RHS-repeat-containing protein [Lysobacter dokdonensis DS-58]